MGNKEYNPLGNSKRFEEDESISEENILDGTNMSGSEWLKDENKDDKRTDEKLELESKNSTSILNSFVELFKEKFIDFKSRFQDIKENVDEQNDDDAFENMPTPEEITKKRESQFKKRLATVVIGIPIVVFVLMGLVKSYYNYQEAVRLENTEQRSERENTEAVVLPSNSSTLWKTQQEEKQEKLEKDMSTLSKTLTKNIKNIQSSVEKSLKENTEQITSTFSELEKKIKKDNSELEKKIKKDNSEKSSSVTLTAELEKRLKKLEKQNAELKQSSEINSSASNSFALLPPPIINKEIKNNDKDLNEPTAEYVEVMDNISFSETEHSTYIEDKSEDNNNKTVMSFRLGTGLAQARVVTGTVAPTLEYGTSNPEPIFLSLTSSLLMPNDYMEDISDCMLIGAATGSFSNGRVTIRLSKMECHVSDLDGNMYVLDQKVEGWVFGEDGSHGVKGRLITKEGQIIAKALPLGFLEGIIGALSESSNLVVPTTGTDAGVSQVQTGAIDGFGNGATKIVNKIADYYVTLLNSLNPSVEVRAGRKVTVAFKGGEIMELKPYEKINTAYFEERRK